ncbi:MAG TPA: hypothetical protein VEW94_08700 [Chloroflexia bacterium]|nr:hypothetical protein [Chloroflexia bacterium]
MCTAEHPAGRLTDHLTVLDCPSVTWEGFAVTWMVASVMQGDGSGSPPGPAELFPTIRALTKRLTRPKPRAIN